MNATDGMPVGWYRARAGDALNELSLALADVPAPASAVPDPVALLVEAAREIGRVREAQAKYTRDLQGLASEARRTGKSQSHRIPPRVYDYGNGVDALIDALEKYERRASLPRPAPVPVRPAREVAHEFMTPESRCVFGSDWGVFGDAVNEHSAECDSLTAAVEAHVEADRASRP
jgi:hypothetical protein